MRKGSRLQNVFFTVTNSCVYLHSHFMFSFSLVHLSVLRFAPPAWPWSGRMAVPRQAAELAVVSAALRAVPLHHPQSPSGEKKLSLPSLGVVFSLTGGHLSLVNAGGVFNGSLEGCFLMLSAYQRAPAVTEKNHAPN